MSGMELPLILGAGGALVGSQVDKKNPLRGALLGGAAGGLGGAALAPASAATTAGTAASSAAAMEGTAVASSAMGTASPFATSAYQAAVPGLTMTGPGSQAAMLAAQTGEFGLAGLAQTAGSAYAPGTAGSAAMRALASTGAPSPAQALAANRAMGGFQQPQMGGTQTQSGMFRPGQQVNLADPIASLLAPKRKKERPMISLL